MRPGDNVEYGREHSPFLDVEKQWDVKIRFFFDCASARETYEAELARRARIYANWGKTT
jgi:hypothetical protein